LRVKGVVWPDGSDSPVAIHGVQHVMHAPMHLSGWPVVDRRSRVVFIVQGLDRSSIETSLRAFLNLGAARRDPEIQSCG
jgi:G3E family GTPase